MAWHTRFQGSIRGDWRDVTVVIQEDLGAAPAEVLPLDLSHALALPYGDAGGTDTDDPYGDALIPSSCRLSVLDDDGEGSTPLFDALDAAAAAGEDDHWRVVISAPAATIPLASGDVAVRAYAWTGRPRLSTLDRVEFPGIEGQATVVDCACGLAEAKELLAATASSGSGGSSMSASDRTLRGRLVNGLARLLFGGAQIPGSEGPSIPVRFLVGWHGYSPAGLPAGAGPVPTVEALRPGVATYPDPDGAAPDVVVDPFDADGSAEAAGRPVDVSTMLRELTEAFDARVHQAITAQPDAEGDPLQTTPVEDLLGRWLAGNAWMVAHPWAHGVEVEQADAGVDAYAASAIALEEEAEAAPTYVPPIALAAADVSAPPAHGPRRRTLRPALRAEVLRKARGGARFGPPGYTADPAFRRWDDVSTPLEWTVVSGTVTRIAGIETTYAMRLNDPGGGAYTEVYAEGPAVAVGSRILEINPRAFARASASGDDRVLYWGLSIYDGATTYYLNAYVDTSGAVPWPNGRFYWSATPGERRVPFGADDDGIGEGDWQEWRGAEAKTSAVIAALLGLSNRYDLTSIPPCPASGLLRYHLFGGDREPEVDSAELLMPQGVLTAEGADEGTGAGGTVRAPFVVHRERGLVGVGEVPWEQLVDDGGGGEEWIPAVRFQSEDGTLYDDLALLECTSLLEDRGLPGGGYVDAESPAPASLWLRVPVLVPPEQVVEYPAGSGELWRVGAGATLDLVTEHTEGLFVRCIKRFPETP